MMQGLVSKDGQISFLPTIAVSGLIVLYALSLVRTQYCLDDASFYYKYVEALTNFQGWRFNVSDPPIWGASAPLWPLLLSIPGWFGVLPNTSGIFLGYGFTLAALLTVAFILRRESGTLSVIALVVWFSLNFRVTILATQGLETPLSYLLIAVGGWTVLYARHAVNIGVAAGLLMIHKLDLAPAGVLLLLAVAYRDRQIPWKAITIALLIATAWYSFAAMYFGTPLPNSFLTKFQTSTTSTLPWTWFLSQSLRIGINKYLLALVIPSWFVLRGPQRALLIFGWGLIIVHVIAYTVRPPSENFIWYCAPVQFTLTLMAAITIGRIDAVIQERGWLKPSVASGIMLVLVIAVGGLGLRAGWSDMRSFTNYIDHVEADRTAAGQWVAQNTTPEATVATAYGNPAYYSHRYTYDLTFLNRKVGEFTKPDKGQFDMGPRNYNFISKYLPDIVIDCPYNSGIAAAQYSALEGYQIVKYLDYTQKSANGDFFCAIMARSNTTTLLSKVF
jgi:hypothetical protein